MDHECVNVAVRSGGSLKKIGLPIALLVPMYGPVSGTRRIASLKSLHAFRTEAEFSTPNSRDAIAARRSSTPGASLQQYHDLNSVMRFGL